MRSLLLCLVVCVASGQIIEPPKLGCLRDRNQQLRTAAGVAGSFLIGAPERGGILSAGCSGRVRLVKTATAVFLLDQANRILEGRAAPPGPARFTFSPDGSPDLVYFPETGEAWRWKNGEMLQIDAPPMRAPDGSRIRLEPQDVVIERDGEPEVRLPLPAPLADARGSEALIPSRDRAPLGRGAVVNTSVLEMEWMSEEWIHLRTREGEPMLALRIARGRERIFVLPEVR